MSDSETLRRRGVPAGMNDDGQAILARLRAGNVATGEGDGPPQFTTTQSAFIGAHEMHPTQPVSNVGGSWTLQGPLDPAALERALARLVARHDALRMSVRHGGGPSEPQFADALAVTLTREPVQSVDPDADVEALVRDHVLTLLPLKSECLWSLRLFALGPDRHVLSLVMHHLISDAWSRSVFIRDLMKLYDAEIDGVAPDLPPVGQFRRHMSRRVGLAETSGAVPPELDWPGHRGGAAPPDAVLCETGTDLLPAETFAALRSLARVYRVTPFTFCVAAFAHLLSAFCDQMRFGLSVSAWDRATPEDEQAIGAYIRDLSVEADLSVPTTFADLLGASAEGIRSAQAQGVDQMTPGRAAIGYYNTPKSDISARHLTVSPRPKSQKAQSVNLHLSLHPSDAGLAIRLDGQRQYFDADVLARLAATFRLILEAAIRNPEVALADLPLVTPEELQVQAGRSVRPAPEGSDVDIPTRFAAVAADHPDALALVTPMQQWNYAELDRDTDALAHWLRGQGLLPGQRLAVALPRGTAVVRSWLAALKAGLVVVPVDSDLPEERVTHIVADARCDALLAPGGAGGGAVQRLAFPEAADLADLGVPAATDTDPTRPAFVMFTSGTTGLPKSIPVPHAGLVRLALGSECLPVGPGDRVMQLASPGFDGSFVEVWGAWLRGAALTLCDKHIFADGGVPAEFRRLDPTAAFLTTSLFNMLVDSDARVFARLKWLSIGGEAASADHCRRALSANPELVLSNNYGPTENASFTTNHRVTPDVGRAVPIGRPMPGNATFVLSDRLRPVPDGFAGELLIGGPGLSPGYENRPEARAERFVSLDRASLGLDGTGAIQLYRTGDRVRWTRAGVLDYLGRRDSQFKLNGYRVEPSEIEAALTDHPAVGRAAVLPDRREDGTVRGIVAFYEPRGETVPSLRALRDFLVQRLPRPILPGRIVSLDALPLTQNGKAHHAALACHPVFASSPETGLAQPDDPLVKIWQSVLETDQIPEDADFHTLGGTSMALVRMILDVELAFGVEIDFSSFAADATLRRLRVLVAVSPGARNRVHLRDIRKGDASLAPLVVMPSIHGQAMWAVEILDALQARNPVVSLIFDPAEAAQEGGYARTLERMVDEIAEMPPGPPPVLVGYSFGGTSAAHLATCAAARGVDIGKIVSIDGPSPLRSTVPNPLRADSEDPLRRQFYLHPAAPLTPDIHLIRATRSFPVAKEDYRAGWAALAAGRLFVQDMDTYHGCFSRPVFAPQTAARLDAILSGTTGREARVAPSLGLARIDWSNRVKAALRERDLDAAYATIRAAVPPRGPMPDHVALSLIHLLRTLKDTDGLTALAAQFGARTGHAVWTALAEGNEAGLAFQERAHRLSGATSGAALPLIEALHDAGETSAIKRLRRSLDRRPSCALEAQLAEAVCLTLRGDAAAGREVFARALEFDNVAPIHAVWSTQFLGRRGYVTEARALIRSFHLRFPDQAQRLAARLSGRKDAPRLEVAPAATSSARARRFVRRIAGWAV
ncbi:non-ribosomal peptide synthetase [Maritimibacter sp. UBA3975]|uniref:non-ribosomal peptide synthetase n=1 Tax=Maritimibacter sp. UBA3975 TaxID=1946833 RepID=UPI000C0A57DA|nr:non-ribosomal peptide synthetase [Maritimibacter sp. UBA3975]MAM63851.1 hypothetical protein [Maritimibacter sp.]|tara:strand:- start:80133 stop:84662 length:4530 start_codon:yes stop_codon:yes gene_type:complete